MKRAIIYGRVSTNKQSPESIETQIIECQKWANDNGCVVVDIYDDSGQSGRAYNVNNRDGFQQIKEDAKNGRMDYALIHKIDRFARSVADYFIQERALNEYGVKIVVVGMPFFQNADIVTKSVHIAMAEQFSVNLSDEVKRKMRTHAFKSAFLGGKPPYGFTTAIIDGQKILVPHPEHSQAIQLIYQLYLQGNGYVNISKKLAKVGYLNDLNEPFTASHIRKILTSKKYNGYYTYGNRFKENGKDRKNKDKNAIIEIPNVYEKIIDDDTFNAVQNKINENVPRNKTKRRFYPLTGKMTCNSCGRAITGFSSKMFNREGQPEYNYYRCTGKKVNSCDMPSIPAELIEDFIFEKIKQLVFDEQFTLKLIKRVRENLSIDIKHLEKLKIEIEKKLKEIQTKMKDTTKEKIAKKIKEELYDEIIEDYNKEYNQLELRLLNISQQLFLNDKSDEIIKYVNDLKNGFIQIDAEIKSVLLRQVVQAVKLDYENIIVYLSFEKSKVRLSNIDNGVPMTQLDKKMRLSNDNNGEPITQLDKQIFLHNYDGIYFIEIIEQRKKQG